MRTSLTRLLTTTLLFGVLACVPSLLFAQGNGGGGPPPVEKNMPPVVTPDFCWATGGIHVSGDEASLALSDDLDFVLRRRPKEVQSRTEFEVMGISPTADPTSFAVTLEGAVIARSPVVQTIELFDYDAAVWVLVDTWDATRFFDSTVTVTVPNNLLPAPDLGRFVARKTHSVEARIRYQSVVARQSFASSTDQFVWTIGQ